MIGILQENLEVSNGTHPIVQDPILPGCLTMIMLRKKCAI
jgi:hypothetical protein